MRFLITFICVYCLVAVLADIPDALRRVKRNEVASANASTATATANAAGEQTKTELKEFAKVKADSKKISKNEINAEKVELTKHDNVGNLKANSADTVTKNETAGVGNTVEHSDKPLKAEKKHSISSGKLITPYNFFWRDDDLQKRQHFIENSPLHIEKSAENAAQHSALFTYDTPHHHSGNVATASGKILPDLPLLQKQRFRHFRQGMPYSLKGRNAAGRNNRNKKSFGGKRKTVLVLHSPHSAKFISKEGPHKITDNLIKEETQQLELDNGIDNDFAEHEPKKNLQSLGYFDMPLFPWGSSQISNFDNQYVPSKPKHVLDTVDNFMKFANMMLYKVGVDGVPYHAQTTRISGTPDMIISATSSDNHDNNDYTEAEHHFYNTDNSHLNQHKFHGHNNLANNNNNNNLNNNDDEPTAFGTLEFSPPLQLKNHPKEPKKLLNLIENALDTMLLGNGEQKDDSDEEIEVHCPIHHAASGGTKKNINGMDLLHGAGGEMDEGEHFGLSQPKNEVMEVCQCHFIKKKKDAKHH